MKKDGIVIVLAGFSGVGKGTIRKRLLENDTNIKFSISATSRAARAEDEEGRTYFFKTREEFEKMIQEGELLEWADYCGNYYGTPKSYILDTINSGIDILLEIEINGARRVKEIFGERAVLIYILPPSKEELKRRLANRGEEEEFIHTRMMKSAEEIKTIQDFNYIVVNDTLEEAVSEIEKIIASEKHKYYQYEPFIERLLNELNER